MATLSRKDNPSKRHTNHCLRVTAISILKEKLVQAMKKLHYCRATKNWQCAALLPQKKRRIFSKVLWSTKRGKGFHKFCVKVGKFDLYGEIPVNREIISMNKENNGVWCSISVNFNGNFENCFFNINQRHFRINDVTLKRQKHFGTVLLRFFLWIGFRCIQ